MAQYYYLIAGLPDLLLDDRRMRQAPAGIVEEIEQELTPADADILRLLLMPADHRNLLKAMGLGAGPFDPDGALNEQEIARLLREPRDAPAHVAEFMSQHAAGRTPVPGMSPGDHLAWLYYEEVADHPNAFVREWCTFDRDLRNVLAACVVRDSGGSGAAGREARQRVLVGRDETTAAILRDSAPDFGLAHSHPWVTRLVGEAARDPQSREKTADTLRWEELDELTALSQFGVEAVLAFVLRYFMVRRWLRLEPEEGGRRLSRLMESLMAAAPQV